MFDILNAPPVDPFGVPLLGSHWPILTIVAVYLLFTLKVGRKLMENREPFDLRGVIKVYNIVQILYNGIMLVSSLLFMLNTYDLKCVTNLPMDHEWKNTERWLTYSYFLNKILDLLDTIFFVLRKKHGHLTFLHIFHHSIMPYICFTYIRFYGHGGHGFFLCFFNVSVHVFMYTYYYISVHKDVQANLWFKKYITIVQLTQFFIILVHCIYTLRQPNCNASRNLPVFGALVSITFIILFLNFYVRAYIMPKKKASDRKGK
ncbi:elongation of very long chain fatty acids protein F-like isoform X1 [Drosophila guanche]|uniref:Elongation of very long chain fatty acids protein n=1 Tax=Drosophila guanche TaxID=7266 RepID=A0A3B0JPI2_DROGU|nr:elongation of very long chain fatty acids protein F-like isoform X1 [Drosophila guanche]SPP82833.1 blast:Elongation of very long chain fatty acids protein 1 [Drosophila guanche]